MVTIYTSGSCYNFFFILKSVFPDAELYDNLDHGITKIGDKFYDINGEAKFENHRKLDDSEINTHSFKYFCGVDGIISSYSKAFPLSDEEILPKTISELVTSRQLHIMLIYEKALAAQGFDIKDRIKSYFNSVTSDYSELSSKAAEYFINHIYIENIKRKFIFEQK